MVWPTILDSKLTDFDVMDLPGQQLAAANAYTPLDHFINLDSKIPPACQHLTGIMANMGKSTSDIEVIEQMIYCGMNIAALNLQFGTREEHIETIKTLRQAVKNVSAKVGKYYPLAIAVRLNGRTIRTGKIAETIKTLRQTAKNVSAKVGKYYPLAIAVRLNGRTIRTGEIAENLGPTVELKEGEVIRLTTDDSYKDRCSTYTIFVDFVNFADQMNKNDVVIIDNDSILLKVEIISSTTLTCKIERGGELGSYKDVFVPHVIFDIPNFSKKDKADIEMAIHYQLDILIVSFIYGAKPIEELRALLGSKGKKISIISNIQTMTGFKHFDEILSVTDGVMITRQELASDISPNKLVIAQKNMIARANKANVPVTISAHILCSMRYKQVPLRSELLDISNCILDGADSFMLSGETAVGMYPVETVMTLVRACREAEACLWTKQIYHDMIDLTPKPCDQATGACLAGVLAAQRSLASAIVVITTSGKSARIVSKYKPRCPIIAVTRYQPIARQLHLWRGVVPIVYTDPPDIDWQADIDKRVNFASKFAIAQGFVRIGDPIVLITGWRQGSGFTNTMRVVYADDEIPGP